MAILPIRIYPDPVLREPASRVSEIDDSVRKLIADMKETMHAAEGAGLAAPQVGVQRRVFVYQVGEEGEFHALVNPEVVERSDDVVEREEGCLSIPGLAYPVTRAHGVTVRGTNERGEDVSYEAVELEARVIQHEMDHLDGILYIDRLTPDMRRDALHVLRERALETSPTPAPRTPAVSL